MRKFVLLTIISTFSICFSQVQLQLRLQNNVPLTVFNQPVVGINYTSNAGLNQILAIHAVSSTIAWQCATAGGSHIFAGETNPVNLLNVLCNTTPSAMLINQLINYNSLVANVGNVPSGITYSSLFVDRILLYVPLSISFAGYVNSVPQTTNPQLNNIFQDYHVDRYENAGIGVSTPTPTYIRCSNCNVVALQAAIAAMNSPSVVSFLNTTGQLSIAQFESKSVTIAPNPFENQLNITSSNNITSFEIIDLLGKKILNATTKQDFDLSLESTIAGAYILKLSFENGTTYEHKILKISFL